MVHNQGVHFVGHWIAGLHWIFFTYRIVMAPSTPFRRSNSVYIFACSREIQESLFAYNAGAKFPPMFHSCNSALSFPDESFYLGIIRI